MAAKPLDRDMVIDLLGTSAMDRATIARELIARGVVDGDAKQIEHGLMRALQDDTAFTDVAAGVMYLPAVVDGTVWTVWIDAKDAAEGFVREHPHLGALSWWLIGETVELVDESGTVLGDLETDGLMLDDVDTDVLLGPPGWLDGLGDQWASVAVSGRTLCCAPCEPAPTPDPDQVEAIKVGFGRAVDAGRRRERDFGGRATDLRFTLLSEPVDEALVAEREAFLRAPIAPLPELYAAAGLEVRGASVAEAGFDWAALSTWQMQNRFGWRYGLDPEAGGLLANAIRAAQEFQGHAADGLSAVAPQLEALAALLTRVLDRDEIAEPFWFEALVSGLSPKNIGAMVNWLVDARGGAVSPGLGWLRSRVLDTAGDVIGADALLRELATSDCRHGPLLMDAAAFASDRGDAISAFRLLTQAGVVERLGVRAESGVFERDSLDDAELLLEEVAGYARHRPAASARRNDPCPCGSGRKYKVCHLGKEQHALADRANWLYAKACRFERQAEDQTRGLAHQLAGGDHDLADALLEGPFLPDLALHEGGAFDEFLDARGDLLPDDEALLAQQWGLVDRGVFEVRDFGHDWLDLYNVGRGESIRVVNTHPSSDTRVGALMFGRPLPVGDTYRALSGFINVAPGYVDVLHEAIDARDLDLLIDVLGRMFAPPRLHNTDGEPMVLHTLRWRVPDTSAVDGALTGAGLEGDGDGGWLLGRAAPDGGTTVLASITRDGDQLIGEVNSVERAETLRALIDAAIPTAGLVDETVQDMADALAARRALGDGKPTSPETTDPAARELVRKTVASYEARWVEEPVPALGGRTPRDAVGDPIGREQVIRLLDSFPVPDDDDIGMMDPRRLRDALGL